MSYQVKLILNFEFLNLIFYLTFFKRETAHVIRQLNNDYLYAKKQKKLARYYKLQEQLDYYDMI